MFARSLCALVLLIAAADSVCAQGVVISHAPASDEDRAADEREAKRVFLTGKQAFEDGRFADAVTEFRRAYALSGKSAMLFNIGLAADRLRDDDSALNAFERFLREQPNSPDRVQVEQRVAALRTAVDRRKAEAEGTPRGPAPASSVAPSASETATRFFLKDPDSRSDADSSSARTNDDRVASDDGSVFERWWFWTAIGVVAAGSVTAAVLLTQDAKVEAPLDPRGGVLVMTLGRAR